MRREFMLFFNSLTDFTMPREWTKQLTYSSLNQRASSPWENPRVLGSRWEVQVCLLTARMDGEIILLHSSSVWLCGNKTSSTFICVLFAKNKPTKWNKLAGLWHKGTQYKFGDKYWKLFLRLRSEKAVKLRQVACFIHEDSTQISRTGIFGSLNMSL